MLYNYSTDAVNIQIDSSQSPVFVVTFPNTGEYLVTCTVTDADNLKGSAIIGTIVTQCTY